MIKVRDAVLNDAEKIQKIYAPYVEKTVISFELEVPNVEEMGKRIKTTLDQGFPYLVIEDEYKNILGYAYGSEFGERKAYKYSADLSIYLDMEVRSRGLGQKLYDEFEKKMKKRGIVNLVAIIVGNNEKSIKFHTKNGFIEIGRFEKSGYKFGEWLDIIWMKKQINDYCIVMNEISKK